MTDLTAQSRPLSVPNMITIGRVIAVPLLVSSLFFIESDLGRWIAFGIFVIAAASDFVDGYLARAWQQQSAFGKMLDPIADKLLVGASVLMLVYDSTISGTSIWAALIILCREILVSGLREFLAELQVKLHVTWLSKWKTIMQLIAIGLLIIGPAAGAYAQGIVAMGMALLWVAAFITLWTGYGYTVAAVSEAMRRRSPCS